MTNIVFSLINTLRIVIDSYDELLKERLEQASDTIANLSASIAAFNTIYVIITVLIGLLTFTLPVLIYFFGIRPSRLAIKELQEDYEKKFEQYLKEIRERQVEEALNNLMSDNKELKEHAVNYLILTKYQGFSDQQLFKIYQIIKSNQNDEPLANVLPSLISHKKNLYATDFFKTAIYDNKHKYLAMQYLVKFEEVYIYEYINKFIA